MTKAKVTYHVDDEIIKEMKEKGIDIKKEIVEGIQKHFDEHNEEVEIIEKKEK